MHVCCCDSQLANEALKALNLDVARRSYIRLRDTRYIELVARIEAERRQVGHDDQVLIATVLAHQGKFQEAAKLYCKANRVERAIDMFSDLRKWDEARHFGIQEPSPFSRNDLSLNLKCNRPLRVLMRQSSVCPGSAYSYIRVHAGARQTSS